MTRTSPRIGGTVLLLAALLACGGDCGGDSKGPPPGIVAVLIGFASGGAPPGFAGAVVDVVDASNGAPVSGAQVVLNGVTLTWSESDQSYEGAVEVAPGSTVSLAVTTGGATYRASANFFTAAPTISLPDPPVWPAGCENLLSWSDGQPAASGPTYLAFFDAAEGDSGSTMIQVTPGSGEITLGSGMFAPGERLVFVGTSNETPVPGAAAGSVLVLVNGRAAPLTVADADFRKVLIQPEGRGVAAGGQLALSARGPLCNGFDVRDLTAEATWHTSNAAVVTVSSAAGSAGVATGIGPGTATVTAEARGIRGTTAVGVRAFTVRSGSDAPDLCAVTWTGTTAVAVGRYSVATSTDWATWVYQPVSGFVQDLRGVAASPGRVVAIDWGTASVLTSADLATWTEVSTASSGHLQGVIWDGGRFVAVGEFGAIVTSPDGLSWTELSSGPYALTGIAAGGPRLLAVGGSGSWDQRVVTSTDGVAWDVQDLALPIGFPRGVVWSGREFVAIADDGTMTSPDGLTWTAGGPAGMVSIAVSPSEVMAVSWRGEVAATTDGKTWITWSASDHTLQGVAWAGDRWVIVGYGVILTSP